MGTKNYLLVISIFFLSLVVIIAILVIDYELFGFLSFYKKNTVAFTAVLISIGGLAWQVITEFRNRIFRKKVHSVERKIYALGVCNDVYEVQLKPVIRNIIKNTPSSAKLTPKTFSLAEKIYDQFFHLYTTMKELEKIDKESTERIRLFMANSILWSCHFIEAIYAQCEPEKFENHMYSSYRRCRSLDVTHYFSKDLPHKANISNNYDIDIFS